MRLPLLPLTLLPFLLAACGSTSTPAAQTQATAATHAAAPATAPSTTPTLRDAGSQTRTPEENAVFEQVNAARSVARQCGTTTYPPAPPLTWNGYLAAAARAHAADMADKGYFAHVSADGSTLRMRAEKAGYTGWRELGENIAAGYGVSTVLEGWLQSPSHCATLMDPALKELGIGYVAKPGSQYGTYWVKDFGTR